MRAHTGKWKHECGSFKHMCIESSQVACKHLSGINDPNRQHILGALAETQQDLNKQHGDFSNKNQTSGMRKLYIF